MRRDGRARRPGRVLPALVVAAAALLPVPAPAQETAYRTEIRGAEEAPELERVVRDAAALFRLEDRPAPSPAGLRRRADSDRDVIGQAMRSLGYYDGVVAISVDAETDPAVAVIQLTPGPRYVFASVSVEGADGAPLPVEPPGGRELGLVEGEPALARAVVDAQATLVRAFTARGHRFARIPDRRVVVDHAARTMEVVYVVDPGPLVRFGETEVRGLERVDEGLVRGRIGWRPGDVYDPAVVDTTRRRLQELGAFTTTAVALPDEPPRPQPDGTVVAPAAITLTERPRRFIGAGLQYTTADGFGGSFFWGHRNLLGGAEQLRLRADVQNFRPGAVADPERARDELGARLGLQFRKPDVFAVRQSLVLETEVERERPRGYDRDGVTAIARLERQVTDRLQVTYGVLADASRTRRGVFEPQREFLLAGLPLGLSYDGADDLLNPGRGYRLVLSSTPFYSIGTGVPFLQNRVTGTAYLSVDADRRYVLAGRASLGSIAGGSERDVPADRLFYVGGGGSVRGYGFQQAGRLDAAGDPIGGRSLLELGVEMRMRVTESIGVVPFLDAGTVEDSSFPTLSEGLRYGVGVGLRYFTGFGPIRVDVATPLDRRREDSIVQLYISIGQAF